MSKRKVKVKIKVQKEPTKKELLKMPHRKWDDTSRQYREILLVPAGTKHDSGFMHIAIIGGYIEDGKVKYEICGYPDDISTFFGSIKVAPHVEFTQVRMDCFYPSGVLRYHGNGTFFVSTALSSMDIRFTPHPRV